ncbi:TenA family protein [Halorarius halobius]|uniref:TenA family protein n=1 Tax=Halorarius halobius TaxID=2962671 RepID=UPI0020CFE3B3|nr:TenA family protein [Halorarius halobius]
MTDAAGTFAAYADDREDARFTDWLRARSEPGWTEATTHRFVRELGGGDLSEEVFRRYLVQDYAFLETGVGAFGHAVGQAPTMDAKSRLAGFLATLTGDENDYFERAFETLGVSESTYGDPEVAPTTAAFRDLLERAAREGGYAETLAVLVPAEWVYRAWATAIEKPPDRFYFAEWVDLHAVDDFREFVAWLRAELDREGAAASQRRQRRIERLFVRTVELEAAFFEAAYDPALDPAGGDRPW